MVGWRRHQLGSNFLKLLLLAFVGHIELGRSSLGPSDLAAEVHLIALRAHRRSCCALVRSQVLFRGVDDEACFNRLSIGLFVEEVGEGLEDGVLVVASGVCGTRAVQTTRVVLVGHGFADARGLCEVGLVAGGIAVRQRLDRISGHVHEVLVIHGPSGDCATSAWVDWNLGDALLLQESALDARFGSALTGFVTVVDGAVVVGSNVGRTRKAFLISYFNDFVQVTGVRRVVLGEAEAARAFCDAVEVVARGSLSVGQRVGALALQLRLVEGAHSRADAALSLVALYLL